MSRIHVSQLDPKDGVLESTSVAEGLDYIS